MIEQLVTEMALGLERFGDAAYLVVGVIVFLETVVLMGQFVPGSIILLISGFLCYMQVLDFTGVVLTTVVSHYAGEWVNYFIGVKKGRALFSEESRIFKPAILAKVEEKFAKWGAWVLIIGQHLGIIRPFVSVAAGISHYSKIRFAIAMVPACILWAILPVAIGYFGGASWQKAAKDLKDISLIIIIAIPVFVFSAWLIRQLLEFSGGLRIVLGRLNRKIRKNPKYIHLAGRHPRLFNFLERRISMSRPWGLNATFGFLSAFAVFFCFLLILWDIEAKDIWFYFDVSLINLLVQIRTEAADRFFVVVTHLGSAGVVSWIVAITCLWCFFARQHKSLFVILCSVVLTTVLGEVMEVVIQRNRPDAVIRAITAHGFSFPSGHATVAFALFGSLYYWLWNHPGILKLRATVAFVLLVLALLVGISRLYLGVHYPSDVTAGFCLGLSGVIFSATIAANWTRLADAQRRADIPAVFILVLLVGGAYAYSFYRPAHKDKITPALASIPVESNLVWDMLPRESRTLFGKKYVPINLVVTGSGTSITKSLEEKGWSKVDAEDFFTRELKNPVFPAFVDGHPAVQTLEKRTSEGRTLLRLWDSGVESGGEKFYVGNVVLQDRVLRLKRIVTHRQDPDMDLALDKFKGEISGFSITEESGFMPRKLYEWERPFFTHGNVLFIDGD